MWNERYTRDDYLFGTEAAAFLVAKSDLLQPGLTALVVADGEGRNSVFAAERGVSVTAMDASTVGTAKAKRLAKNRGVSIDFHVADIHDWDWAVRTYDLVICIFIQFLGPDDRTSVFAEMQRALRPGGRLLLHGYRPEQLDYGTGGPPVAENMYTEDILRAAFADLEIEELRSYDAEISEGTGHVGMSALIDFVGRKPQ